jgi:Carboxypeptidase regulatory-like domain
MMSCRFPRIILILIAAGLFAYAFAAAQELSALAPEPAAVVGTVVDVNGGVVPGATVILSRSNPDQRLTTSSDGKGFFQLPNVPPGTDWHVTIRMHDFADWISKSIVLTPGQYFLLTGVQLHPAMVEVSVSALTREQVATEEVHAEEKQRILGSSHRSGNHRRLRSECLVLPGGALSRLSRGAGWVWPAAGIDIRRRLRKCSCRRRSAALPSPSGPAILLSGDGDYAVASAPCSLQSHPHLRRQRSPPDQLFRNRR